ncbi:hypothetical protein RSK20926_14499 [Roseobacter sp. SK209-2-6]|nr:hypothetical protein RSK20926_14499 [Roseobacter sp. SK209-2-6]
MIWILAVCERSNVKPLLPEGQDFQEVSVAGSQL